VPLWMALHLKQKRKCRIVVPTWLSVGDLTELLHLETTKTDFSELPRDWLEISKVLLEWLVASPSSSSSHETHGRCWE
jgi:GINS complex subunit 2